MRRRDFIALLGGSAVWPLAARAEARQVVGFLNPRTPTKGETVAAAFRKGLEDLGFVDGHNVAIEYRWARDQYNHLPALAAELVDRGVSVIVAGGGAWVAAKAVTKTIPIVFTSGLDPVRVGMVGSLSRPEANITGATFYSGVLVAKQLEMLRELLPKTRTVAMLLHPSSPSAEPQVNDVSIAAQENGLTLHIVKIEEENEFEKALASIARLQPDGLLVGIDPFFDSRPEQTVELSARSRVPTIYYLREFVEAGGLICYGGSIKETYRQAGAYAGRILKGATPAELPVVQPTRFDLVINLKTAKAVGVTVPPSLLARADEVIE